MQLARMLACDLHAPAYDKRMTNETDVMNGWEWDFQRATRQSGIVE
jgi:hypothetical protein